VLVYIHVRKSLCLHVHARVGMIAPTCALCTCAGSQLCAPTHMGVIVSKILHAHAGTIALVSTHT
jgi:hypothetical protein